MAAVVARQPTDDSIVMARTTLFSYLIRVTSSEKEHLRESTPRKIMLRLLLNGDDDALRQVYSKYRKPLINWLKSEFKMSASDAEDTFQHAVVIMWDNVNRGKVHNLDVPCESYLYGVCRNLGREYIRRQKRTDNSDVFDILRTHVVDDSEIEEKIALERDLEAMEESMRSLGPRCYDLLYLFYIEKQSMDSIAVLMGYSGADSAKTQRYKCVQRLRKKMGGRKEPPLNDV